MVELEQVVGDELAVGDAAVADLDAHAQAIGRPMMIKRFAFVAREGGEVVGRVMGSTFYCWAFLKFLAVADGRRRAGVGSALLARFEDAARAEGAVGVMVDTYAFQAPAFYARHGYVEMGRLKARDPAETRIYFTKTF